MRSVLVLVLARYIAALEGPVVDRLFGQVRQLPLPQTNYGPHVSYTLGKTTNGIIGLFAQDNGFYSHSILAKQIELIRRLRRM